jgi:N-acetylneuraminic acid mutarotase
VNDFYEFCFKRQEWRVVPPTGQVPPPRDRHVSVVFGDGFYVFGGFDGVTRVNDFYAYDFGRGGWAAVAVGAGSAPPPSPRHSHGAVIYGHSMFCFGGYDGSYRSDFHAFSFATNTWSQVRRPEPSPAPWHFNLYIRTLQRGQRALLQVSTSGRTPRARYRSTCVVHGRSMVLFGGHDGTR